MFIMRASTIILIVTALQGINSQTVDGKLDPETSQLIIKKVLGTWYLQGAIFDKNTNYTIPKNSKIKIKAMPNSNSNKFTGPIERISIDGEIFNISEVKSFKENEAEIDIVPVPAPGTVVQPFPFTVIDLHDDIMDLNCYLCPFEYKIYSRYYHSPRKQLKKFEDRVKITRGHFEYVGNDKSHDKPNEIDD